MLNAECFFGSPRFHSDGNNGIITENVRDENPIVRLAQAIGYPDGVPDHFVSFAFKVDDYEVRAKVDGGSLILSLALEVPENDYLRFAGYAAGRMLKEEATLAYDPAERGLMLWQSVQAVAGSATLRQAFEDFTHACDWWRTRALELNETPPEFPEMIIRP